MKNKKNLFELTSDEIIFDELGRVVIKNPEFKKGMDEVIKDIDAVNCKVVLSGFEEMGEWEMDWKCDPITTDAGCPLTAKYNKEIELTDEEVLFKNSDFNSQLLKIKMQGFKKILFSFDRFKRIP